MTSVFTENGNSLITERDARFSHIIDQQVVSVEVPFFSPYPPSLMYNPILVRHSLRSLMKKKLGSSRLSKSSLVSYVILQVLESSQLVRFFYLQCLKIRLFQLEFVNILVVETIKIELCPTAIIRSVIEVNEPPTEMLWKCVGKALVGDRV